MLPRPRIPIRFRRIGAYRVLSTLGEGGMGVVYKAEQDHPHRTVALKLIKAGFISPEFLHRFGREADVLGRFQHPGIAQIYDAGTADDGHTPYFAMEYVAGRPLTDYADAEGLDTRARLTLMAGVCDAVHHAHQRGVIHRDLKPANILVDASDQPKVLDFGIARMTDADVKATMGTDLGQLVGTLPYMSPEQVGADPLDLDTRSDVYTLGIILFQLLAGRLPYPIGRELTDAARTITQEEPPALGSIDRAWRGDVETIAAKALEKEPSRRYQSAAELAADIRRHLAYEPIAARRATLVYQVQKFARRKPALVGGAVATVVAVVLGLIGTGYGLVEATRQRDQATLERDRAEAERDRAEQETAKATAINEFLQETLGAANPRAGLTEGPDVTVLAALDAAVPRIAQDLADQPEIEAAVRDTIGRTYSELGQFEQAETQLTAALRTRQALAEGDSADVADSLHRLGVLALDRGDSETAERRYREALAMRRRLFGDEHTAVALSLNDLSLQRSAVGDYTEAVRLLREALAMQRSLGDAASATVNNLAVQEHYAGNYEEAEALYREALDTTRERLGERHTDVGLSLGNLAFVLYDQGKIPEAEQLLREALAIQREQLGPEHRSVAAWGGNLAMTLVAQGRDQEAVRVYRDALRIAPDVLTRGGPQSAERRSMYGVLLTRLGRYDEAEPHLLAPVDLMTRRLGERDERTRRAVARVADLYDAWGKPAQAADYRALLRDPDD